MAVVDAVPLVQHVLGLGRFGVVRSVGLDVISHVREQVCTVPRFLEAGTQAAEIASVFGQFLAEKGEVILLESGGCKARFSFQKAR